MVIIRRTLKARIAAHCRMPGLAAGVIGVNTIRAIDHSSGCGVPRSSSHGNGTPALRQRHCAIAKVRLEHDTRHTSMVERSNAGRIDDDRTGLPRDPWIADPILHARL